MEEAVWFCLIYKIILTILVHLKYAILPENVMQKDMV